VSCVINITVRVENSATWLTLIVSLPVRGSGLETFDATETKATSRNVCVVTGVGPAELPVPIMDIQPSLSRATREVFETYRPSTVVLHSVMFYNSVFSARQHIHVCLVRYMLSSVWLSVTRVDQSKTVDVSIMYHRII